MVNQTQAELLQQLMGQASPQYAAQDGIVAHAGGTKAAGVPLTAYINRIVTVATTNDSVMLPVATVGTELVVSNAGVNTLAVFSYGGDVINALASTAGYAVATGHTAHFWCAKQGQWHTLSGS